MCDECVNAVWYVYCVCVCGVSVKCVCMGICVRGMCIVCGVYI